MAELYLTFLGSFRVSLDGDPVTSFPTDKVRALLAYLALEGDRAHGRSSLAGLFWPDVPERQARDNLRLTLYRLRKTLDRAAAGTSDQTLSITRHRVQFHTSATACDALLFQARLEAVTAHRHESLAGCQACLASLEEAAGLYRGELLSGLNLPDAPGFEEWLLRRREYFHHLALRALARWADVLESRGEVGQAYGVANRLLALDPYREGAQQRVMRLLARQGLPDQALARFESLRQLLREELDVEPDAETTELARQITAGAFDKKGPVAITPEVQSDWSEAPLVGSLFGRSAESEQLRRWLTRDRCQVVTVLGMGGLGKSTLAAHAARALAGDFEAVLWRTLLNDPPLDEVLAFVLPSLSGRPVVSLPGSLDQKLALLLDHLRRRRCLLVLDNVETVLLQEPAGRFVPGCEEYGHLIRHLGEHEHQSCLLLTSRERPEGLVRLEQRSSKVRSLLLAGLDVEAARDLLHARGLDVAQYTAARLNHHYSGNPLALNLVAQTIQDLYAADVDAFLTDEAPVFADIRQVLDQQLGRLGVIERDILFWLAIAREALPPSELKQHMLGPLSREKLLEALRTLERRSLLEKSGSGFSLQNVVTEYLTGRLVEQVSREIEMEQPDLLHRFALLHARVRDYVRQAQIRLILGPIGDRLATSLGLEALAATVRRILDDLRKQTARRPGYAAGNLLNLLLQMEVDVQGYDFSHLSVWQAHLQSAQLPAVDFRASDLSSSVFVDTFGLVWSVACSPDGQVLAAGTVDGRVRLWHAATGQPFAAWPAHEGPVYALAFSPDAQILASGGAEGRICLWQAHNQRPVRTLEGHAGAVQEVAFCPSTMTNPGGQLLASASEDGTIHLWDVASGETRHVLAGHVDFVLSVAFHPNGWLLASGARDQTVHLWDVQSGQPLGILEGHQGWVTAVAFGPDGRTLATSSEDGTIQLWDVPANQVQSPPLGPRMILAGHNGGVQALAFDPDGRILASGGNDHTVRLWDLARGRERHILQGHRNWVRAVAFGPDGQTLVSGSWDHSLRWWDIQRGQTLRTLQGYAPAVFGLAFAPDGQTLASATSDGLVRVWDVGSGQVVRSLPGHSDWIWRVAYRPSSGRDEAEPFLVSASMDGTLRLWDASTGQAGPVLREHAAGLQALAFSPDGRLLASGDLGGQLLLTDLEVLLGIGPGWQPVQLEGHTNWCLSQPLLPAGNSWPAAALMDL